MKKASSSLRYLYVRNGRYLYRRPIPPELHKLAGLTEFKQSLRTNVWDVAVVRYGEWHSVFSSKLEQLREGKPLNERKAVPVSRLRDIATERGFAYKSHAQLANEDAVGELQQRMDRWAAEGYPEGPVFDALFGSEANTITLDDILTFYELHTRDRRLKLNARETSKQLNPVRLAVKRFNEFAGLSLDINQITRKLANDYRGHLIDAVEAGSINAGTANKQITHVRKIVSYYIERNALNLANPFARISIKEERRSRVPYSVPFLRKFWMEPDAFKTLNREAKGVLFAMIDTGCGAKEICGVADEDIVLDHEIPHIIIRPNRYRRLKTNHRDREIPLVGHALQAMQQNPKGFPGYRTGSGADNLSATLMKYLSAHSLLETSDHTVYSLRHTFMDRMRQHSFPDELQTYLMGHKHQTMGARYGAGYTLERKLLHMKKLETDWT